LKQWFNSNCKKWAFQLEKADTGYLHYQCRFSLIKKRYPAAVRALFPEGKAPSLVSEFLEPTSNEASRTTYFYVLKEDTRVGSEFYCDDVHLKLLGKDEVYVPRQIQGKTLYPYQQFILDSMHEFDDRRVNCLCDHQGENGKSFISSYCALYHNAINIPVFDDYKDIMSFVCNICRDNQIRQPKLMFCDVPRGHLKNRKFITAFCSAIEQIKKGELYDPRYHAKTWWIDSPQIWIFVNDEIDNKMLSRDRWVFWSIDRETKTIKKVNGSN